MAYNIYTVYSTHNNLKFTQPASCIELDNPVLILYLQSINIAIVQQNITTCIRISERL